MIKAGIKFCGHCMPTQSMYELYDEIVKQLPQDITLAIYVRDPNVDVLVTLNGCTVECADSYGFNGPILVVSPQSVNHWKVPIDKMPEAIFDNIRRMADPS